MARRIRMAGWVLAVALAVLGLSRIGWQRLSHTITTTLHGLAQATMLMVDAGWPLLLIAIAIALGLTLTGSSRRKVEPAIEAATRIDAVVRRLWLQPAVRLIRWLLALASLVALLVLVVAVLPPRFTTNRHFDKASDELKAQNDVRTTLLQALAGALLAAGAYLTWRQVHISREGQITERYTKAVEQLGHDELDVRLGGIYALERIARDSAPDRATIEEVLTAFVRGHAPWPPPVPASAQSAGSKLPANAAQQSVLPEQPEVATEAGSSDGKLAVPQLPHVPLADVQAALTVLGRRHLTADGPRLDLTRVDLRGAQLNSATLQHATLQHANLQDANLQDANLEDANLEDANLQEANLQKANLQHAKLSRANFQNARLQQAKLQNAELLGANLQGASLRGTKLKDAQLLGAQADTYTHWPEGWSRSTARDRGVYYVS